MNNKIYSNNNNILLEIINELNKIKSDSNENLTIQRLGNIINKMNYMINILNNILYNIIYYIKY